MRIYEGLCPLLNKECKHGSVEAKRCQWYDEYNESCSIRTIASALEKD